MSKTKSWNDNWVYKIQPWGLTDPSTVITGETITLPHTWYKDDDYYRGEGVYQKIFPYTPAKERVFVKFHGVDKICKVFINGAQVGCHEGGYTIFAVELTNNLIAGDNVLTVLVSNAKNETVSPLSGDFASFGGIHRKVELITTSSTCFDRTYYGCDGVVFQSRINPNGCGELWAEAHVLGDDDIGIRYSINQLNPSEFKFEKTDGLKKVCEIKNPVFWNGLDDTKLYTARADLLLHGQVIDTIEKQIGFRKISIDPENGFFLNDHHMKLHGVAKHQDSDSVFSAATMDQWQRDIALIHEIGANAIRLSHYPHPTEVYDLCDKYGFVVWAEIPLLKLTENETLFANAKQQLKEMVLQNMHHPSICFWGLQNEIAIYGEFPFMTEKMKALNEMAHALDSTRLTACANLNVVHPESTLNQITDVTAYNIYYGWYYGDFADNGKFLDDFHKTNPNMPLAISEYGADASIKFHSADPKVNDYSEEFQALYHETVYPMIAQRDFVWGSFVWNMFDFTSPIRQTADVKNRNIKGLVTFDRQTRKDSFFYYKAMWAKDPFVYIAGKRYQNRAEESISVKVYSNQPNVTLTVNGKTVTQAVLNGNTVFSNIALNMGANRITAQSGHTSDEATFYRKTEEDPSYTYVDQHPGLNVRNWFLDEKEEAELFPEGFLSIRSTINELLANEKAMQTIDRRMPDVGAGMRDMVGTFELDKFFAFAKPDYSEEEIRTLNAELTKIKKS